MPSKKDKAKGKRRKVSRTKAGSKSNDKKKRRDDRDKSQGKKPSKG